MDRREARWRTAAFMRIGMDRVRFALRHPRWNRRALASVLAPIPELGTARRALMASEWDEAERALAAHFGSRPARFLIAPGFRTGLAEKVRVAYPTSAPSAKDRADRLVAGEYDLLGYSGLRFECDPAEAKSSSLPEWTCDPVHGRHAPAHAFWASVPYLSPECGDHKIIWELNRHQHWLALGRAYWLTCDSRYRRRFIAELTDWLAANPPLAGINWASMLELALRSLSWVWALELFTDPAASDDVPWTAALLAGIDRQLRQVERNLSYYFSPNTHLLGEALALYVCGRTLPELRASARWAETGRRVLLAEIDRQITGDGGHCERSTHYHRYALDFYLLALAIARITRDDAEMRFERAAARLAFAARLLADDRGRLPHIGDDDGGVLVPLAGRSPDDIRDTLSVAATLVGRADLAVGQTPEEACWWLAHPALAGSSGPPAVVPGRIARTSAVSVQTLRSAALPETGYYISRSASGHLVVDGGPHGYQNGGHAHADALSFTFSIEGVPLLIDPGTGSYTSAPELRDRLRSTALHNTVVVDDRPQSVPDGPFHWQHTAGAAVHRWRTNERFDYFDGEHDGYAPIVHRRHLAVIHGDLLIAADLVSANGSHVAAAHWHVDPSWNVQHRGPTTVLTRRGSGLRVEMAAPIGTVESFSADAVTGLGWHAPVYGRVQPATTMRITHSGTTPFWLVTVFGFSAANPVTAVELLPVWSEAGALRHWLGLRIVRECSTDLFGVAEPATADGPATWRLNDLETDARMLFVRLDEARQMTRVALCDGSLIRSGSRRSFDLLLPRTVPDVHVDLQGEPRIAGPAFGARIVFGGREHRLESERRSSQRL